MQIEPFVPGMLDSIVALALRAWEPVFRSIEEAMDPEVFRHFWMRQAGVPVAMVETGADPGHAPARQVYERMGFRPFPVALYFKKL